MLIPAVREYKDLLELCRAHEAKLADSDLHVLGVDLYSCKLYSESSEFCDSVYNMVMFIHCWSVSVESLNLGKEKGFKSNEKGNHHI